MKAGIYCIYYNTDNNKYYIGRTICFNRRFTTHMRMLKKGTHHNCSLQKDYYIYGDPIFEIIEQLSNNNMLSSREKFWIKEFDAYTLGYNLTVGGEPGSEPGDKSTRALYNNSVYYNIFIQLATTNLSLKEIAEINNVDISIVRNISAGASHKYFIKEEPILYEQLILRRRSSPVPHSRRAQPYPKLLSPLGEVIEITNATEFANINKLNQSNLSAVLNGKRKSHLGYTLYE